MLPKINLPILLFNLVINSNIDDRSPVQAATCLVYKMLGLSSSVGSISSVFSEDVAKACNEAIEDVVNDHYNRQVE